MRSGSFLAVLVVLVSISLAAGDGVKGEKEGVCPPDNIRCFREDTPQCYRDRNCDGAEKCCYWHCGFKCVMPVKSLEEDIPSPAS